MYVSALRVSEGPDEKEGALIGIELLDPENTTVDAINDVLKRRGLNAIRASDLKPIVAA